MILSTTRSCSVIGCGRCNSEYVLHTDTTRCIGTCIAFTYLFAFKYLHRIHVLVRIQVLASHSRTRSHSRTCIAFTYRITVFTVHTILDGIATNIYIYLSFNVYIQQMM